MIKKILKRVLVSALAFSVLATSVSPSIVNAATPISGFGGGGGGGVASGEGPRSIQGYNLIIIGGNKGLNTYKIKYDADHKRFDRDVINMSNSGKGRYWGDDEKNFIFMDDKLADSVEGKAKQGVRQGLYYLYNSKVGDHTAKVVSGYQQGLGEDFSTEFKFYANTTHSHAKKWSGGNLVSPEGQIRNISKGKWIGSGLFVSDTTGIFPEKAGKNLSEEKGSKRHEKWTMEQLGKTMPLYSVSSDGNQKHATWGEAKDKADDKLRNKWAALCDLQMYYFESGAKTPDLGHWTYRVASMFEVQAEGMKRHAGSKPGDPRNNKAYNAGMDGLWWTLWMDACKDADNKLKDDGSLFTKCNIPASENKKPWLYVENNIGWDNPVAKAFKKVYGSKETAARLMWSYSQMPSIVWRYIGNCVMGKDSSGHEEWAKKHTVEQLLKSVRAACMAMTKNEGNGGKKDVFHLGFGEFNFIVTPVVTRRVTTSKLSLINGIAAANMNKGALLNDASHHTWTAWFDCCNNLEPKGKIGWNYDKKSTGYNYSYVKDLMTDNTDNKLGKGNSWLRKSKVNETILKNTGNQKGYSLGFVEPWADTSPDDEEYKTISNGSITNQTVTVHDTYTESLTDSTSSTNVYINSTNLENNEDNKNKTKKYPYGLEDSKEFEVNIGKDESADKQKEALTKLAAQEAKTAYNTGGTDKKKVSSSVIGGSTELTNDFFKNHESAKKTNDEYVNKIGSIKASDYIIADKQSSVNTITSKVGKGQSATALLVKQMSDWKDTKFNVANGVPRAVSTNDSSVKFGEGYYFVPPKYKNFSSDVLSQIVSNTKYLVGGGEYKKNKEDDLVLDMSSSPSLTFGDDKTKATGLAGSWSINSGLSINELKNVSESVASKYSTVYYAPDNANKPDHEKKENGKTINPATGWSKKMNSKSETVGLSFSDSRTAAGVEPKDTDFGKDADKQPTIANTGLLLQKNPTVYSTYSSYYIEMSEDVASSEGVCWYNGLDASDGTELSSLTEKQVYDISGMNKTVKGADLPVYVNNNSTSYVYGLEGGLFKGKAHKPEIYEHKLYFGTMLDGTVVNEAPTTYKKDKNGNRVVAEKGIKTKVDFDGDKLASKYLQGSNGESDVSPAMISNYALLIERTNNNPNSQEVDWNEVITKILKSLNTRRNGDFYNTKNIIVGASGASKLESALKNAGVKGVKVNYIGQGSAEDIKKTSATVGSKVLDANNVVGYDIVTLSIKKANLPIVTAIHTNPDEVNHIYGDILGDRSIKSYSNYTYGGNTGSDNTDTEAGKITYVGNDSTISGLYEKEDGSNILAGRDANYKKYYYTTIAAAPKVSMFNVWNSAQTKVRWNSAYSGALADYSDAPYCSSPRVSVFRASYYTYYTTNPSTHTKTSTANYFKNSKLRTGRSGLKDNTFGSQADESGDSVAGGNIPVNASKPKYNGWNNKGISGTSGTNAEKFTGTLMNDRADSTNPDGNSVYLLASGMLQDEGFVLTPNNNLNTSSGANKLYRMVGLRNTPAYHNGREYVYNKENLKIRVTGRMIYDFTGIGGRYNSGSASPNNVLVLKKSDIKLGSDGTEEGKDSINRGKEGNASASYGVLQKGADASNNVAKFADAQPDIKPVNDITNNTGTMAEIKNRYGNIVQRINADGMETIYSRGLNGRFRWNALGEDMSNRGKNNQLIAYDAEINEQDILDYMVICRNYTYQTMSTLGLLRKKSEADSASNSIIGSDNSLKPLSTKSEREDNSYMASKEHSDRFYSINGNNDKSRNYFVYSRNTGKYLSYYPEVGMKAYAFTDSNGNVKQVGNNNQGAGYISYDGTGVAKNVTKRMIYTVGEAKRVFAQKSINIISTNIKDGNKYRPIESRDISSATVSDAIADSTDSTSNGNTGTDQKQVIYQGANINLNSSFNNKYLLLSNYTLDLPVGENASTAKNTNGKSVMLNGDVTYSGYTAQTILGMTGGKTNDLHNLWNHTSADGTTDNVGISALSNDFKSKYFAGTAHKKDENGADIDGAATDEQFEAWASQVEKSIKPDITLVMSENNAIRNVYKDFNKTALKVQLDRNENKDDINKVGERYYNSYMIIVKDGKIVTDSNKRFNYETGKEDNSTSGTYLIKSDWYQLVTDVAKDMGYDTSTANGWSPDSKEFKDVARYVRVDSGMLDNLEKSMMTFSSNYNHSITKESKTEHFGGNMSVFNGITGKNVNAGASAYTGFSYQGVAYNDGGGSLGYAVNNTANKWYSENTSVFIVRRSTRRLNLKSVVTQDKLDIGSGPSKVTNDTTLQDIAEDNQESTGIGSTWDAKWYLRLFLSGDGMSDSNNYVLNGGDDTNTDTYLVGESDKGKNKEDKSTWGIHLDGADFLVPDATTSDMRR